MITYILPILCLALIVVFFTAMPPLKKLESDTISAKNRSLSVSDAPVIVCLIIASSFLGFFNLGSTECPETYCTISENSPVIGFEAGKAQSVIFYSRIGIGTVVFQVSEDGSEWSDCDSFEQNYAQILKWHCIDIPAEYRNATMLRVLSDSNVQLGELAVVDETGSPLPLNGGDNLTDEQNLIPLEPTYYNSSYFDEIYHVRTAIEHIENTSPYEISHPPLGKLIISLGILIFGENPFGWRFMGVLVGVLMVPEIYVFGKKMFGGIFVPSMMSLFLASDFMHLVQTRIATIDSYSVFFIILMYLFMYMYINDDKLWCLALSGVFFGLGCASKWTCIYAGAGLAVIWLADRIRKRKLGFKALIMNSLFCCIFFIAVPALIYYLSYFRYGTAAGLSGLKMLFSREYLDIVVSNQKYMFTYHSGVTATHPYSSRWYQWVLDIRPILYYLRYYSDGTRSTFGAWLNPMLCWGGLGSMLIIAYCYFVQKDRKAGFILTGYLAQLVPWMFVTRITFEYHYFPSSVFLILGIGYCMNLMYKKVRYGALFCAVLTCTSCFLLILFLPVLTGIRTSTALISSLYSWLPSWPF